MYFIRGCVIAMSVFVLVYVALSLLVGAGWRALHRDRRRVSSATAYGFRILPLVAAILVVALFTVPSFLRFEPRWDGRAHRNRGPRACLCRRSNP